MPIKSFFYYNALFIHNVHHGVWVFSVSNIYCYKYRLGQSILKLYWYVFSIIMGQLLECHLMWF